MFSNIRSGRFCLQLWFVVALVALPLFASAATAEDDLEVFRVYSWSSLATPDSETRANCRAIDKKKGVRQWAVARREVADVSELEEVDDQEQGSAFRVFVDFCVRVDGNRERPVGAMIFKVAPMSNLASVQRWGSRHYRKTSAVGKRTAKPIRDYFNRPRWK